MVAGVEPYVMVMEEGAPIPWVEMEVPDRPPVGAVLLGYTEDGTPLVLLLYET